MRQLLDRAPLPARAAEQIVQRRKAEAYYRPHRANRTETSPVTFWRGLGTFMIRAGLKTLGVYERGRSNALNMRIVEQPFHFVGLPQELDGFRILQISDLHLPRRFPAFAEKVASLVRGVEVDLCVLTGDYRYGYLGPTDHVPKQLHQILAGVNSRHGIAACLGNHDTAISAESMEIAGIPILFNEGVAIHEGGATLWLCGIDDPHNYGCDRIDMAVRDAPEGAFIILLAHTPERVREAADAGVSLYLTGHTHGGQIRLPWIGAVATNADCARKYIWGAWQWGAMSGYTTSGIGVTDVPVRYNCPPEVVVATLRRA